MYEEFGALGTSSFSLVFGKVMIGIYEPWKEQPFTNPRIGASAGLELLHALAISSEPSLRQYYRDLKEKLEDELWQLDDHELTKILVEVMPFSHHEELTFLCNIPVKKLQSIPPQLVDPLISKKLVEEASLGIQKQVNEQNPKYFIASIAEFIRSTFSTNISDRTTGYRLIAERIASSEPLFRVFANKVCCDQYIAKKALHWATVLSTIIIRLKENRHVLRSFIPVFDLVSEMERVRRRDNTVNSLESSSVALIRTQLAKLITAQATTEEKKFALQVTEFEQRNGITDPLKAEFRTAWSMLTNLDKFNLFKDPVTEVIAPGYFQIITHPMDLSTIAHKIENNLYTRRDQFLADVNLMFNNAFKYNHAQPQLLAMIKSIRQQWEQYQSKPVASPHKQQQRRPAVKKERASTGGGEPVHKVKKVRKPKKKINHSDDDDEDSDAASEEVDLPSDDDSYGHHRNKSRPQQPRRLTKKQHVVEYEGDKDEMLDRLFGYLVKCDERGLYMERVTDDDCPNYSQVVRRPMYLRLIQQHLNDDDYSSIDDFNQDICLMLNNCIMFHGEDSDFGIYAKQVKLKYKKFLQSETGLELEEARIMHKHVPLHLTATTNTESVEDGRSGDMRIASKEQLSKLLTEITKLDKEGIFMHPVSDDFAPGYSREITTPMDFNTLKGRVSRAVYKNCDIMTFIADVSLIFTNCIQYNGENSALGIYAMELQQKANKIFRRFLEGKSTEKEEKTAGKGITEMLLIASNKLVALDYKQLFVEPVTDEIAPGYSAEITTPMCTRWIKNKITNKNETVYVSFDEFIYDVRLIFANCAQFNGEDSPLAVYGRGIEAQFLSYFDSKYHTQYQHAAFVPTASAAAVSAAAEVLVPPQDPQVVLQQIKDGWNFIHNNDINKLFLEQVTDTIAPDYSKIIPVPQQRWLGLLRKNAKQEKYPNFKSFTQDADLMFDNCIRYNGEESEIGQYAMNLQRLFHRHCRGMLLAAKREESSALPPPPVTTSTSNSKTASSKKPQIKSKTVHADAVQQEEGPKVSKEELLVVWEYLRSIDPNNIFLHKVTNIPNYSKIIRKPMYMTLIQEKINSGEISTFASLKSYVESIVRNCQKFNGKDSEIGKFAENFRILFLAHLKDKTGYVASSPAVSEKLPVMQGQPPKLVDNQESKEALYAPFKSTLLQPFYELQHRLLHITDCIPAKSIIDELQLIAIKKNFYTAQETKAISTFVFHELLPSITHVSDLDKGDFYLGDLRKHIAKLIELQPDNPIFGNNITFLTQILQENIEFLTKCDTGRTFKTLPNIPGYEKLISSKTPIAISILAKYVKLTQTSAQKTQNLGSTATQKKGYYNLQQFHEDVRLMGMNCLEFNGLASPYTVEVLQLMVKWEVFYRVECELYPYLVGTAAKEATDNTATAVSGNNNGNGDEKKRKRIAADDDDEEEEFEDDHNAKKKHTSSSAASKLFTAAQSKLDAYLTNPSTSEALLIPHTQLTEILSQHTQEASSQTDKIRFTLQDLRLIDRDHGLQLFSLPLPMSRTVTELINLSTMEVKLDRGEYHSKDEVWCDLQRMAVNRLVTEGDVNEKSEYACKFVYTARCLLFPDTHSHVVPDTATSEMQVEEELKVKEEEQGVEEQKETAMEVDDNARLKVEAVAIVTAPAVTSAPAMAHQQAPDEEGKKGPAGNAMETDRFEDEEAEAAPPAHVSQPPQHVAAVASDEMKTESIAITAMEVATESAQATVTSAAIEVVEADAASSSRPDIRYEPIATQPQSTLPMTSPPVPQPQLTPQQQHPQQLQGREERPQPSELLLTCRSALDALKHANHTQGISEEAVEVMAPLPELPAVGPLRWSLLLLKQAQFQAALLEHFARLLTSYFHRIQDVHEANKMMEQDEIMLVLQLCLLRVTQDLNLHAISTQTGTTSMLLRVWLPRMILSVVDNTKLDPDIEQMVTVESVESWLDREGLVKLLQRLMQSMRSAWGVLAVKEEVTAAAAGNRQQSQQPQTVTTNNVILSSASIASGHISIAEYVAQ